MNIKEIIELIINKAYEVRDHFIAGYLENVCKKALLIEFREAGLIVEEEVEVPVTYKGYVIGIFRVDIVVDKCVIIELEAVAQLLPAHAIQLVNYLSVPGIDDGLLINFGSTERLEIRRKYRVYDPHN